MFQKILYLLPILILMQCVSAENKAAKHAVVNVCPDLGKLEKSGLDARAIYTDKLSGKTRIAVKKKDGATGIYDSFYILNAKKISSESHLQEYKRIYEEICSSNSPFIDELPYVITQKEKAARDLQEKEEWSKILKSGNTEKIYNWAPSAENTGLTEQVKQDWTGYINRKTLSYCKKTFPVQARYCDLNVFYTNGSDSGYKVYQLFNTSYLAINKNTGIKMGVDNFKLMATDNGDFQLFVYNPNDDSSILFFFKEYKGKVTLIGLKSGYEMNPNGWEYIIGQLLRSFSNWPSDGYWDFDFIDKIK